MNARALLLNLVNVTPGGGFTFMDHDEIGGVAGGTTGTHNTTGATLIVISAAWYGIGGVIISDSKSNTYIGLTPQVTVDPFNNQLYYINAPTVGAGHTFTAAGVAASIAVVYFSGSSSGFDTENGSIVGGDSSMVTGSITPSVNNALVIAGLCDDPNSTTYTIDSGMTPFSLNGTPATNMGVGVAYKIQTSAAPINPTWSWIGVNPAAATIASFKP